MLMERIEMLETYVDNLSMKETVSVVNDFIANKRPLHLMGVNADKINELRRKPKLKKIINSCDIIKLQKP